MVLCTDAQCKYVVTCDKTSQILGNHLFWKHPTVEGSSYVKDM
jgi:hypothetical protein